MPMTKEYDSQSMHMIHDDESSHGSYDSEEEDISEDETYTSSDDMEEFLDPAAATSAGLPFSEYVYTEAPHKALSKFIAKENLQNASGSRFLV